MTTHELLLAAKAAAPALAWLGSEEKNAAILRMADAIVRETDVILAANEADVQAAKGTISDVMLDRLRLTEQRVADIVAAPDKGTHCRHGGRHAAGLRPARPGRRGAG